MTTKKESHHGANRSGLVNHSPADSPNYTTPRQSPLDRAKERMTIAEVWAHLGLPGKPPRPGQACHSPLRDDKRPSFAITRDGMHCHDFATGENWDQVDLIAAAKGCSLSEAAKTLIAMAGSIPTKAYHIGVRAASSTPATKPRPIALEKPTYGELLEIQKRRQLPSTGGLHLAVERGLLWCADVWDDGGHARCWVVTDDARIGAQARRLDGEQFTRDGVRFKSKTLPGYRAPWPVGAANFGEAKDIILTEGPPDMLAAMTLAAITPGSNPDGLGFACVCGAASPLMTESLTHFAGKTVRFVYHQDKAGEAARKRWCKQLSDAGADVLTFDIAGMTKKDGTPAKDLNDVTYFALDDGESAGPDFPEGLEQLVETVGEEVAP